MSHPKSATESSRKRRKTSPPEKSHNEKIQKSKRSSEVAVDKETNGHDQNGIASIQDEPSITLPSVKDLASSDPSARRMALKEIILHIENRAAKSPLSSTECLQIWRGYFVAIYMHDSKNMLSVQNLLREISSTFHLFSDHDDELWRLKKSDQDANSKSKSMVWFDTYHVAFWQTLVREWAGIDSHRMNKYLLLVRFIMRELATISLRPMFFISSPEDSSNVDEQSENTSKVDNRKSQGRPLQVAKRQISMKAEAITTTLETVGPLNSTDRKIPDGLRLHVLDLYADEIFGAVTVLSEQALEKSSEMQDISTPAVLDSLCFFKDPLIRMAKSDSGAQKHVRRKAADALVSFTEGEMGLVGPEAVTLHEDLKGSRSIAVQ